MPTVNDLRTTFAVLKPGCGVDVAPVSDTLYSELDERYDQFAGHVLIACHHFDGDWPTWEMHPRGDEIVCLIDGDVNLVLKTPAGEQVERLKRQGQYVVVPAGTWHTARVNSPTTMIFITPGEGTENRETPE